jgi:hypothetical protein
VGFRNFRCADVLPRSVEVLAGAFWRRIGVAALVGLAAGGLASSASAQTAPTVTAGQATSITTTGVLLSITVNPQGNDTLYRLNYGPSCDQLTSSIGYQDAGSGTGDVAESVALDGLSPSTSYCYQAEIFQNATQADVKSNTVTFTTAANATGPGVPIFSPQFPPGNGIFTGGCQTDAQCLSDVNGVRAAEEQLAPLVLPTNWTTLTLPQQVFVATNLERVSRGLTPIPNLVNTYDADVQTGVSTDMDPDLSDFTNGGNVTWTWESIWAGAFPAVWGAMYGWEYNDGYNPPPAFTANVDCTSATAQGCWGHRQAILDNPKGNLNPTEMDAVVGNDNTGQLSYAAALTNNTNTAPGSIVFTWAQEQQFLAPPPLGGLVPRGPRPTDSHLTFSRSRFPALPNQGRYRGRTLSTPEAPSVLLDTRLHPGFGTVISYRASQVATTTLTIQRVIRRRNCVASKRHGHQRAKSCIRYVAVGTITLADRRGANRFRFTGRLNGHELAAGGYRMIIQPRSAHGRRGSTLEHLFTIVP